MRRFPGTALLLLAVAGLVGCQPGSGATADPDPAVKTETESADPPATPEGRVYEQLRAGAVQLDLAQVAITEAYSHANAIRDDRELDMAIQEGAADVSELLDSAGAQLGDFTEPPADEAAVAKAFGEHDERRIKAIEAANDALHDLDDALGLVQSLLDAADESVRPRLDVLFESIRGGIDEVRSAIASLGGEIEKAPDGEPPG
ncbi:MAG: hypothetical protein KIS66_03780 [Fimbriimonadaceae bacterium]|nr:hypothetical protein [Fimbriimonadaceae bacterium]